MNIEGGVLSCLKSLFSPLSWGGGIDREGVRLTDRLFADDVIIFANDLVELRAKPVEMQNELRAIGLEMSISKTKWISINTAPQVPSSLTGKKWEKKIR
ncbi:unnamed protein product [Soboliphyme baturini]|uniref:Reverse transcriptase domain-containing protein n=1 Tax=Soboliphyme baturini TaxID=241478 RepID=A0A183IT45_9BILA|nr:unnamed protein product [Soboliphyme baturini]